MIIQIYIGLFCLCMQAYSAAINSDNDNRNPLGCRDVGYNFELNTLLLTPGESGSRQSLYFIFNKLTEPINLYQMRADEGMRTLYLNHSIQQQQWAVLATSEKTLRFLCTINLSAAKVSHYGRIVNCSDSIKICEYNNVIFGLNNRGNYWLNNSYSRNGAVNAVVHYGVIPAQ